MMIYGQRDMPNYALLIHVATINLLTDLWGGYHWPKNALYFGCVHVNACKNVGYFPALFQVSLSDVWCNYCIVCHCIALIYDALYSDIYIVGILCPKVYLIFLPTSPAKDIIIQILPSHIFPTPTGLHLFSHSNIQISMYIHTYM